MHTRTHTQPDTAAVNCADAVVVFVVIIVFVAIDIVMITCWLSALPSFVVISKQFNLIVTHLTLSHHFH